MELPNNKPPPKRRKPDNRPPLVPVFSADKPPRDMSLAQAGRRRAALKRKLDAARELLKENGYVVILDTNPCWSCHHALRYHGPSGNCYVGDCNCGMGPTT